MARLDVVAGERDSRTVVNGDSSRSRSQTAFRDQAFPSWRFPTTGVTHDDAHFVCVRTRCHRDRIHAPQGWARAVVAISVRTQRRHYIPVCTLTTFPPLCSTMSRRKRRHASPTTSAAAENKAVCRGALCRISTQPQGVCARSGPSRIPSSLISRPCFACARGLVLFAIPLATPEQRVFSER